MSRLALLISFVALFGLFTAAPVIHTFAQEGSPAAGTTGAMSVDQTQEVIDAYLAALVAREDIAPFFSDDVVVELVDVAQVIQGREAVAGAIVALHEQMFDAPPQAGRSLCPTWSSTTWPMARSRHCASMALPAGWWLPSPRKQPRPPGHHLRRTYLQLPVEVVPCLNCRAARSHSSSRILKAVPRSGSMIRREYARPWRA